MLKKLLVAGSSLLLVAGSANAGQVIINNTSGLHPITNLGNQLIPLGTGVVAVGSIDLADAAVTAAAQAGNGAALNAAFTQFGDSIQYGFSGSGGFFSGNVGGVNNNDSPPAGVLGQNVDILTGNGATIADSQQFFIFRSNEVFEIDNPTWAITLGLDGAAANGSILAGTPALTFVELAGGEFNGSQMVGIPEPTAGLLLGLGAFSLLLRRRR